MTAKQKALDAISSLPDDTDPQDIVRLLVQIYRIQRGLAQRHRPDSPEVQDGAAEKLRSRTAQVDAWRRLAGQWQSDLPREEEIDAIYAARTPGREVDL